MKRMNKKIKVVSILAVCGLLAASGIAVQASRQESIPEEENKTVQPVKQQETVEDKTVYVFADATGKSDRIVVSDWLQEETDQERKYESEEDLPVQMKVSYRLEGKEISPQQLAGQSGQVEICYEFINNRKEEAVIQGKKEELVVPFAAVSGVILDNKVFTDVEVEGGKLVNDGDRTVVVGLCFPGMNKSLEMEGKLELNDRLLIRCQAENFELMNTMTLVTNEVFNDVKLDGLDDLDSLNEDMDELSDAMIQLMEGSGKLVDGLDTLSSKSAELSSGIDQLAEGSGKLKEGTDTLSAGVQSLAEGIGQLHGGLNTLSENSPVLNAGAAQIFDTILTQANQQIAASGLQIPQLNRENYADVLNGVISSMTEEELVTRITAQAREQVSAKVNENRPQITEAVSNEVRKQVGEQVTAQVRQQVLLQVLESLQLTPEQYEAALQAGQISEEQKAQIEATVDQILASDETRSLIDANTEATMNSEEVQALITSKTEEQVNLLIEQNMGSAEVLQQIKEALNQAQAGAGTIQALKVQLDSINAFYQGVLTYTAGVDTARNGAEQLNGGATQLNAGAGTLKSGVSELDGGIHTLKDNVPALLDGVHQLAEGSHALEDGLHEFDEKGIRKLIRVVDDDLGVMVSRIRKTLDISQNYNYNGEQAENGIRFLYRTESIQ